MPGGDRPATACRGQGPALSAGGTKRAQSRSFKSQILRRLEALQVGPRDVLVLRLPAEVIEDEAQMVKARQAAAEIAEVARRGIVLIEENAPLSAEHVVGFARQQPLVHAPQAIPGPRVGLRS